MGKRSPLASAALARPISYAERLDVRSALDDATDTAAKIRVLAGAIGVCSKRIRSRVPYRGRVHEYGGQVLDRLMDEFEEAGIAEADALAEIGKLGAEAVRLCAYPTEAAVQEALGNSEAPPGA